MKTFAAVTVGGVVTLMLFKLFAALFFPLIGTILGIVMMGVKLALTAGAIYFVWALLLKGRRERERA